MIICMLDLMAVGAQRDLKKIESFKPAISTLINYIENTD